jgi:hypothetical protein
MKPGLPKLFEVSRRMLATALLMTALAALPVASMSQQVVPGAAILDVEEEEEIRRYAVELIIFEYVDRSGVGTEIFDPDAPPILPEEEFIFGDDVLNAPLGDEEMPGNVAPIEPVFTDSAPSDPLAIDQGGADGEIFADDTDVLLPPVADIELELIPTHEQAGLKILQADEYVLDNAYERLETLDAYRPIMRAAWTQPTLEKDLSVPITLRRLGDPPLRLDGTMTLYLSRFLHLVVDLELEEKSPQRNPAVDNRVRRYGDERSRFGFYSAFDTPSTFFRIDEDRIVRNDELRYFDHPRFGVLAKIWRIEEEIPAEDAVGLFGAPLPAANPN